MPRLCIFIVLTVELIFCLAVAQNITRKSDFGVRLFAFSSLCFSLQLHQSDHSCDHHYDCHLHRLLGSTHRRSPGLTVDAATKCQPHHIPTTDFLCCFSCIFLFAFLPSSRASSTFPDRRLSLSILASKVLKWNRQTFHLCVTSLIISERNRN
jgi:hypothetical protein